jgi:putative MATE family efflux protein
MTGGGSAWRDRDHTRGRLWKSLLVLALPGLATSLSSVIFQLADLTFISRLGDAPMASVVIVNQTLRQTFFMLLMGGSFGTQALIAGAVGAGDNARAERIAGQGICLGFAFSASLMLVGGLFPEFLFSLPGPDPAFYQHGVPYVRLVFLLNFGVVGVLFFSSILGGAGDTTTPLFVSIVQTIVAIGAEWVLIFGNLGMPALGVRGVALGIAAGQITAMAIGLSVLFSGRARLHLHWHHLLPRASELRQIARLSWPPAIQMAGGVAMTFGFLRLTGQFGEATQAAYAIGLRLGMLAPMVCFPLASACATVVGQNLGAGNVPRAWQTIRTGLAVHFGLMASFGVALFLFRGAILETFSNDPEVVRAGHEYLGFLSVTFLMWGLYFPVLRSLQGAGDFLVPMALSLGSTFVVALPLGYLLALQGGMGPTGIWTAQLVSSFLLTAGSVSWLLTGRWTRRASHSLRE